MRSYDEISERIKQYTGIEYIYNDDGFIAWQLSTGENVEIMFIESREHDKGMGRNLIREMCKKIKPFNSVFVFRLASNENAGKFYRGLGFEETPVEGLYKCGAVLGVVNYEKLCQNLSIN